MDHDPRLPELPRPLSEERRLTTVELREHLLELLKELAESGSRLVITQEGSPLAALIPYEDFRLIQDLEDQLDLQAIEEAHREAAEQGTIPLEQVKRELGL